MMCSMSVYSIIKCHVDFCKRYWIDIATPQGSLPYFHWLPKLHQKPYGSLFIAASSCCSTTIISKVFTACLGLVKQRQQGYYDAVHRNSGIQGYWLIKNSDEVFEVVSEVNQRGQVSSIKLYDFNALYTNLKHKELKERIPRLVEREREKEREIKREREREREKESAKTHKTVVVAKGLNKGSFVSIFQRIEVA